MLLFVSICLLLLIILFIPYKFLGCVVYYVGHALLQCKTMKHQPDICNGYLVHAARNVLERGYGAKIMGPIYVNCPMLYVLEHASVVDLFVTGGIHYKCRYIGRSTVAKNLAARKIFEYGDHILVDLEDPQSRERCKMRMKKLWQDGYSIANYPEGKLRLHSTKIGKFYPSSISLAIEMQIPIVTVVISGLPPLAFQKPKMTPVIQFSTPILYSNLDFALSDIRKRMSRRQLR